jgi:hypothetical protein
MVDPRPGLAAEAARGRLTAESFCLARWFRTAILANASRCASYHEPAHDRTLDDFRDILVELHEAGARFVVLGGHAVAFHGHPRATKDLDILVEAQRTTRVRGACRVRCTALVIRSACRGLFFVRRRSSNRGLPAKTPHHQSCRRHYFIFAEAIADGESFDLEGRAIPVIGRGALINNKRAAARPQDSPT